MNIAKKIICLLIILCFVGIKTNAQETMHKYSIEASYLYGNTLAHAEDIHHLITNHPTSLFVSFSKKTNGYKEWHLVFNYPDVGTYIMYQDYKNEFLGKSYSVGGHYNFYFLNRNLQFKVAHGISIVTDPYNKETNSKNKAFGSRIQGNFNIGLAYKKDNIYNGLGFHTGILLTHNSNGRTKSPNSGINTFLVELGLNYNFDETLKIEKDTTNSEPFKSEKIKYNLVFRSGLNESSIINSGQEPFYHIGLFVDKRLGRKSALQLGTELFLTNSAKNFIKYQAVAFPEKNISADADYKRVGIFIGHELFINKLSIETQVGFYVYQPVKTDIFLYDRLAIKYYFNDKFYATSGIKTHLFLAEAYEFGVGIRL